MEIKLTANIVEEPGGNGFTSWIEEIPGIVAHGDSLSDAKKELIRILAIKLKVDRERKRAEKKEDEGIISEELTLSLS